MKNFKYESQDIYYNVLDQECFEEIAKQDKIEIISTETLKYDLIHTDLSTGYLYHHIYRKEDGVIKHCYENIIGFVDTYTSVCFCSYNEVVDVIGLIKVYDKMIEDYLKVN